MVDAFKHGRSVHVALPPPAPLPRFSDLPPLPSLDLLDDTDPTRPFVPDPPTAPRTPPFSWAAPPIPWLDEAAQRARNAPTVRPPPSGPPPSRLPAALHGFAAGLACGAIGLLVIRGAEAPPDPVPPAHAATAGVVAGAVSARSAATAGAQSTPAAPAASPVVRAEDLPRFTTRVEDLPSAAPAQPPAPPRRGGVWWRGRTRH